VGISRLVDPFWRRLHAFFAYPFSAHPLMLAALLAVTEVAAGGSGEVGAGAMLIFVWAVRVKYSYEVLKTTARGDLRPPALTGELIFSDFFQVFKQFLVGAVLVLAHLLALIQFGPVGMAALALFTAFFLPSMLILLVTTNRVLSAVNPFLFVPMALRIGWAYLLMCFFLLLLVLAPGTLGYHVLHHAPGILQPVLRSAAETYYSVIFYHLMGYVLLQYSERIGYRVEVSGFHPGNAGGEAVPELSSPEDRLVSHLAPLIQEGRLDDAIDRMESAVRGGRVSASKIREPYYRLVKAVHRPEKLLPAGEAYIEQLLREGKAAKAVRVYRDCAAADKSFSVDPEAMMALGAWLEESRRPEEALGVYNRLVKAHPRSERIPRAIFQAAKILHADLRHTRKARVLLSAALRKYPQDEIAPRARRFLERLEGY
jgi:tetratricopeptide (TPR) repeat protein